MFFAFCLLIAGVAIWRGIMPFEMPKWLRLLLSALALLLAFNFFIRRWAGWETLPVPLLLSVAWCFSVLALYVLLLCVYEAVYWAVWGLFHLKKKAVPRLLKQWFWRAGLLLPAVLIASFGMYEALKMPEVREYVIVLPELPPELDGMTVAHITDVHADQVTDGKKVAEIVRQINALEPDLIVITGDVVDRRAGLLEDELQCLGNLRAKYGVYGVPGNHEYYSGYDKWMKFFQNNGIKILENSHVLIADGRIVLGGVTDSAAEHMEEKMALPDAAKAFAGAPAGKMRILLAHQPDVAPQAAAAGVALQLSGHTHGGMVYGLDLVVAAFNHGMVAGEYDYRNTKVFISNGTGIWSGFPVRFGHSSEIVMLHLRAAKR